MKNFVKWLKGHIKPYSSYKPHKDKPELYSDIDIHNSLNDNLDNLQENVEVGLKITFKF